MRRFWAAAVLGLLLLLGAAPAALAGETWCDVDPPVVITTPGGNTVVVYVVNGGPVEQAAALLAPAISYTARPTNGGRATSVELDVVVANDPFGNQYPVTSQVWSGLAKTGTLYAAESGQSSERITLRFKLNVP